MRALPLAVLAPLLLAGLADLAAAQPADRLHLDVDAPPPGVHATFNEDPACATHELLWQAGWSSASDAGDWAWQRGQAWGSEELFPWAAQTLGSGVALDGRALRAQDQAAGRAGDAALDALGQLSAWLGDASGPSTWALAQAGSEDVCLLSLADVRTGL
jgi:hypothetical protein